MKTSQTRRCLKPYVSDLAREFNPQRVILFGSYARGNPSADSDVDLLVVVDQSRDPVDRALRIRRSIPRRFPLDILVETAANIQKRVLRKDMFYTSILREGRILYEK